MKNNSRSLLAGLAFLPILSLVVCGCEDDILKSQIDKYKLDYFEGTIFLEATEKNPKGLICIDGTSEFPDKKLVIYDYNENKPLTLGDTTYFRVKMTKNKIAHAIEFSDSKSMIVDRLIKSNSEIIKRIPIDVHNMIKSHGEHSKRNQHRIGHIIKISEINTNPNFSEFYFIDIDIYETNDSTKDPKPEKGIIPKISTPKELDTILYYFEIIPKKYINRDSTVIIDNTEYIIINAVDKEHVH